MKLTKLMKLRTADEAKAAMNKEQDEDGSS